MCDAPGSRSTPYHAARARGMSAEMVDLRNSGDTAGTHDRVVGYGAFAFTEAERG